MFMRSRMRNARITGIEAKLDFFSNFCAKRLVDERVPLEEKVIIARVFTVEFGMVVRVDLNTDLPLSRRRAHRLVCFAIKKRGNVH